MHAQKAVMYKVWSQCSLCYARATHSVEQSGFSTTPTTNLSTTGFGRISSRHVHIFYHPLLQDCHCHIVYINLIYQTYSWVQQSVPKHRNPQHPYPITQCRKDRNLLHRSHYDPCFVSHTLQPLLFFFNVFPLWKSDFMPLHPRTWKAVTTAQKQSEEGYEETLLFERLNRSI